MVGVISDTHGVLDPRAFAALADCDVIIHAGDICGPGILEELRILAPVIAVLGNCDYPEYGRAVALAVAGGACDRGILICGTGIGISIAANKIPGIRAAVCGDCFSAEATRAHNDANILALGARVVGEGLALKIVDTFLDTPFSNDERHIRRIRKIEG